MEQKELLFVGSPLLDIMSRCTGADLDRYGLKSDDCVRETEKQESLFRSLLQDPESQLSAGGSSQNSARVAKWLLGNRGRVAFAGCVGEDEYARTMLGRLQSEGVEAEYMALPGESTGVCACLLSAQGDRSMCARLGAAEHFSESHLEEIGERVRRAECIFVEGYFFAHSPAVMLALAKTCRDRQLLSISLSAEYVCRDHAETLLRVLPRVDVLFGNEAEAKLLADTCGWRHAQVEEVALILGSRDRWKRKKPRVVVVTRGPRPLLVARGSDPVRSFPVPGGVKVVDGVGCGDAVAGAFLAVYVVTGDVGRAARAGISAAVEIAQVSGCRPTQKELFPDD